MSNISYLFAANVFVWLGIFGYVFSLVKRNQSLEKDIQMLKETLLKEAKK